MSTQHVRMAGAKSQARRAPICAVNAPINRQSITESNKITRSYLLRAVFVLELLWANR